MQTTRRTSPRAEYRLAQGLRAKESISLGQKFPQLKSLTVNVAYFDSEGVTKNGEMKYKVNVEHAKSVFCFVCPSGECVGGDFDLSEELAKAVATRRKLAIGELRCQGWRRKAMVDKAPCHNLLRYKLSFEYARRSAGA